MYLGIDPISGNQRYLRNAVTVNDRLTEKTIVSNEEVTIPAGIVIIAGTPFAVSGGTILTPVQVKSDNATNAIITRIVTEISDIQNIMDEDRIGTFPIITNRTINQYETDRNAIREYALPAGIVNTTIYGGEQNINILIRLFNIGVKINKLNLPLADGITNDLRTDLNNLGRLTFTPASVEDNYRTYLEGRIRGLLPVPAPVPVPGPAGGGGGGPAGGAVVPPPPGGGGGVAPAIPVAPAGGPGGPP
jgi:hypothetical protein